MAADGLVTQRGGAPAATVLTYLSWKIPVVEPAGLNI